MDDKIVCFDLLRSASRGRNEGKFETAMAGLSIHDRDSEGNTPFLILCQTNWLSKVQKLFYESRIRLHATKNHFGCTALHIAAMYNNDKVIRFLLSVGADPNDEDIYGKTPLHFSVVENCVETVDFLITNGANPTIKNKWGKNCLDYAFEFRFWDIASLLIKIYDCPGDKKIYDREVLFIEEQKWNDTATMPVSEK